MIWVAGFEPAASCSRSKRSNQTELYPGVCCGGDGLLLDLHGPRSDFEPVYTAAICLCPDLYCGHHSTMVPRGIEPPFLE